MQARPTSRPERPADELDVLLDLLASLDPEAVVMFRPVDDVHVDVSVSELGVDGRCAAAGLIGLRAPEGTSAAGVTIVAASPEPDGSEWTARVSVALDDGGRLAHRIDPRPEPLGEESGPPSGLLVDALHRVLGLASPGEPPMLWELALGWWLRDVAEAARDADGWSAADMVHMHPGLDRADGADGGRLPTAAEIASATEEVVGDTSWARLHDLASRGPGGLPDLTAEDAAWMDPTMFARWVVGGLPPAAAVAAALERTAVRRRNVEARDLRRLASRIRAADSLLRSRSGLGPTSTGWG